MTPTPDDDQAAGDSAEEPADEPAGGPSLFETLLAETCDPFTFRLADLDWTVDVPTADEVAALDTCAAADEVLDELLGEDLADDVLDVLDEQPAWVTDDLADRLLEHFHLADPPPGGWAELVRRIDRYGAAIEADLPHEWPGVELAQWFTGARRWPQLYRLLDQLPNGCRYGAAVLSDKDLAQAQIDAEADSDDEPDSEEEARPPLLGETYERALLRAVFSALLRLEHAVYAVNAPRGKAGRPPPALKGPRTARDELMRDDGLDEVYAMFAAVDSQWVAPDDADAPGGQVPSGYRATDSGLVVPD